MSHTQGEWIVRGEFDDEIWCGDKFIARVLLVKGDDANMTESLANARLIAQAPALLNACIELLECRTGDGLLDQSHDVFNRAVAAIEGSSTRGVCN